MFTEEELNTIRWIMDRYEHDGKLSKSMRQRMFEIREKVDKHFDEQKEVCETELDWNRARYETI